MIDPYSIGMAMDYMPQQRTKRRTLGERILNPFSSPYDQGLSDNPELLQKQQGLAWLAAANAASQAPSALTALSSALLAGNQSYGQGIENYVQQQYAADDRQFDRKYREESLRGLSSRTRNEGERIKLDRRRLGIAEKEEERKTKRELKNEATEEAIRKDVDALYGSIASRLDPNSILAAEARVAARRGDLSELSDIAQRVSIREQLQAAGVNPDAPGADKIAEDLYRRRIGLDTPRGGEDWQVRNYGDGSVWRISDMPGGRAEQVLPPTGDQTRSAMSLEDQAHRMTVAELESAKENRPRGSREPLPGYKELYLKNLEWLGSVRGQSGRPADPSSDPLLPAVGELLRREPFTDRGALYEILMEQTGGNSDRVDAILSQFNM